MTILQTETSLVCPRADGDPLVIDLTQVYEIEGRVQDVAFVTPAKAPELLARFNEGYLLLHKQITLLEYELVKVEQVANKRKSIVILDLVPEILRQKGGGSSKGNPFGNEDLREAVLAQDHEYQEAQNKVAMVTCIIHLLKGKMEGMENAFTSVKKILGESAYNMLSRNPGSGVNMNAPVGSSGTIPGIGKARY